MYDGSEKAVEDIVIGDDVMGPDSTPRRVLGTNAGNGELFRIGDHDGRSYVVNADHVLTVKCIHSEGRYVAGEIVDISLRDWSARSGKFRWLHKGFRVLVDYPAQGVPIDPYILGVWLGDGTARKPAVTNADKEVVEALFTYAREEGLAFRVGESRGRVSNYYLLNATGRPPGRGHTNPFLANLRDLGVLGAKHIPDIYLINDRATRLAILAGIIDTDGYYHPGHIYEIMQKSECFARQIARLAASLGFKSTIKPVSKVCTNNGVRGAYWRIRISGDIWRIPVRVDRKKCAPFNPQQNVLHYGLTVDPIGRGDWFGFEVDEDGRFLLADFTVTHNSAILRCFARSFARRGAVLYATNEMTAAQLTDRDLAVYAGVPLATILDGHWTRDERERITAAERRIGEVPIYSYFDFGMTSARLRQHARELHARVGLVAVVVDYLQQMRDPGQRKIDQVGHAVSALKALALELDLPLVVGSQLSRGERDASGMGFRPTLESLRESGEIEQSADTVFLLHRAAYYFPDAQAWQDSRQKGAYPGNVAEVIIAKQRQGESGATVSVAFLPNVVSFGNLARRAEAMPF